MTNPAATWDAIVFDCDGVLVDSEPISNRILVEMLVSLGLPYTLEESMRTFVGRSMASCLEIIERERGGPVPEGWVEDYHRRTFVAFERELRPVRGVEEALDAIPWPVCVASSGDHEKLRTTLGATGLLPRFRGRIFSATEVARGKPHPDLFLYAAERMGADPARCAVVEDSLLGVQAAHAAGMAVYGYPGTVTAERLAEAGAVVVREMADLAGVLERGREPSPRRP